MSVDEDSLYVMEQIQKKIKVRDFINTSYDFCTGSHVGPDTIALFSLVKIENCLKINIKYYFRMVFPQVISQNINIFAPSPMDLHKILSINTLPIQQEKPAIPPFQTVSQTSFTLRHDKHYVLILYIYNADLPRVILIPLFRTE